MHIHMSTSKQLLIVDDDQEIRELLNEYLEELERNRQRTDSF